MHGILDTHDCSSSERFGKEGGCPIHTHDVPVADGTHLNDFPVDKFDSFFRPEESGFRHLENVVRGEKFSSRFHAHSLFSFYTANQSFSFQTDNEVFARRRPIWKQCRML
jgi:hypothetical protein